jgi:hypothetical protein
VNVDIFASPTGTMGPDNTPLCLMPMVSPLVVMDDPSAYLKFENRRRKAREKRRTKHAKHPLRYATTTAIANPLAYE